MLGNKNERRRTYLRIPALTTARTTAFMPALSPPEVRTAIFIVRFVFLSEQDLARLYTVGE
jgi:hypothetical protein